MKKLGLIVREVSESRIKNSLKDSESVFVVKYSKLSSPDLSALRQSLSAHQAGLFVVKNSITRRALKAMALESLIKYIEGPCGLVFIKEDPAGISRLLTDFSKDHENLKIEGGFLKDQILEAKDIQVLAKLPSKEVLRAKVAMAIKSPITGLVMTLHRVLGKFVICLDQIRQKKISK